MPFTAAIREVLPATPRASIVRIGFDHMPFEYAPGQAVLIGSPGGEHRPFSIAGAPEDARRDRYLELLVGLETDARSRPFVTLDAGMLVDVDGPIGTFIFPVHPAERRFLFIAGGTGIAPLRAMLRYALRVPHDSIGLLYSARTPDEFAYEAELKALASAGQIDFRQTVTRWPEMQWSGARGRIDRTTVRQLLHDAQTLCFVCGPPPLVAEMPRILAELGVEGERVRVES